MEKANDGTENGETRGMEVLVVTVGILAGPHSSRQDENGFWFIGMAQNYIEYSDKVDHLMVIDRLRFERWRWRWWRW